MPPIDARATRILLSSESYYRERVGKRFAEALAIARAHADLPAAARALNAGDTESALRALFPDIARADLASTLNVSAIQVMLASAARTMRNDIPAILRTSMGAPTEAVLAALHTLDTTRVQPIIAGAEQAMRMTLELGLHGGLHPVEVARYAREGIGLTEHDMALVQSFEAQLRGAPMDALARTLRNAQHDGLLRAAAMGTKTLREADIVKMRNDYLRSLHAWRAETYTRSTTLDALRQGQLVSWHDAAEGAGVDTSQLVKTWQTTLDGRERPEHHDAHGLTVGIDDDFPVDGGVQVPGEGVYNCRCAFTVRLLPHGVKAARSFLAARATRFAAQRHA